MAENENDERYFLKLFWTVLLLVLLMMCLITPPSKYELTKTVVDADGEPIEGVTVELWRGGTKIDEKTTDSDGKVEFKNLPVNTYTLKIPDFDVEEEVFLNEDKEIENKIEETGVVPLNFFTYVVEICQEEEAQI